MTDLAVDRSRPLRVLLARAHQLVGWPGLTGLGLIAVALGVMAMAWYAREASPAVENALPAGTARAALPAPVAGTPVAPASAMELPRRDEIPLLLTQIEQAALRNDLGWRAADYRITPASDSEPARLEVHCHLKGSYPRLRRLLTQVLETVPAASLRELSLTRSASDSPDVEAKLVFAVWLQETPLPVPGPVRADSSR